MSDELSISPRGTGREVGLSTENIGTGVEACVESVDVVELLDF